jgi:hypothetical protein
MDPWVKHWPLYGSAYIPIGQADAGAATVTGTASPTAAQLTASTILEIRDRAAMQASVLPVDRHALPVR